MPAAYKCTVYLLRKTKDRCYHFSLSQINIKVAFENSKIS